MLKLYHHPLSAFVMKVKIALNEKGLAYERVLPADFAQGTREPGFLAASPRAEIPALVDGDVAVFDSTIILEYIEDKWPQPPLRPASPAERARVRMIEDVMDTQYEPNNWGQGEVLRFGRAGGEQAQRMVAFARDNISALQGWLERQLEGRDWFNGDAFGWGDVVVAPYVARSSGAGQAPAPGSRLAGWAARALQRPSVVPVVEEMAQFIAAMPDMAKLLAEGKVVRQYRDHRLEWMIAAGGVDIVAEGLRKGNIRLSRRVG